MTKIFFTEDSEKKQEKNEDSLRDLWVTKHTNIWILGVTEEKEKKKRYEKIFEKIIVKNIANMGKEISIEIRESHIPIHNKPKEKHD